VKKLVAVLMMLALVAGGAFALNVSWGGEVATGVRLAQGNNDDDSEVVGQGFQNRVRLQATATRDTGIGTFGAFARWQGRLGAPVPGDGYAVHGNAWWRPMDMFRIGAGNEIGFFTGGLGRQGFFQAVPFNYLELSAAGAIHHNVPFSGDMGSGFAFELLPMDGMIEIGVGIPYHFENNEEVADLFQGIHARMRVNLDFGRLGFAYRGNRIREGEHFGAHAIYGYFHSNTLVPGLGLDIGVRYGIGGDEPLLGISPEAAAVTGDDHLALGLGVNFNVTDEFGIRFRGTAGFHMGDTADAIGPRMGFELQPFFRVTSDILFAFNAGVGMDMAGGNATAGNDNVNIRWAVNPYLRMSTAGNASFQFGFHAWGNSGGHADDAENVMNWRIPIGFVVGF
jgi:hypothetical protein